MKHFLKHFSEHYSTWLQLALCCGLLSTAFSTEAAGRWIVSGSPNSDLYQLLSASGLPCARFDTPDAALASAKEGDALLALADAYPTNTLALSPDFFSSAAAKKLRLYVEYPASVPGVSFGKQRTVVWERAVVNSDFFGADLPAMRLLSPQNCVFLPIDARPAHLVLARVAGYDRANFGLPEKTYPLLFELTPTPSNGPVLVASTRLSQMVSARFSPIPSWQTVWREVLAWLSPGAQVNLKWTPTVRPAYTRDESLPADVEQQAFQRGVDWFIKSRLLLHSSHTGVVNRAVGGSGIAPPPPPDAPLGDGSLGILEGYYSRLQPDGSQLQAVSRRGDCHAESAMALAFGGKVFDLGRYSTTSRNLLDYYYFESNARKGPRADPKNGAYGLVAWGISTPAWNVANYGDDNARLLLGTMASAALLGEEHWDDPMLRCLLANLRTTGTLGFRGGRIDLPELGAQGWEPFFRRRIIHFAPHYESYLWACFLWAYDKTGFELFRERTKTAIRMTMAAYPNRWRWTNGIQQERARILLALAWLVRIEDTPEHRAWLRKMADELLARQDASGAIPEEIGPLSRGDMHPPQSNAAYGSGEAPLLQQNGDPVCDMLYTVNFALLGLHEAAAATGDPFYAQAEERLVRFLCRIQVRSDRHPELDGGWFRAFDFRLWDYWASNADAGWGAWSIESGWTQGWITSVLAMRQMKTSLWELTSRSRIQRHMTALRQELLPDSALVRPPSDKIRHAAVGKTVTLVAVPSDSYPGDGPASLTDGWLDQTNHSDSAWLGFHADDLDATVDLGQSTALREVSGNFLQNVRLGIFLPRQVEFLAGDDPNALKFLGVTTPQQSEKEPGPFRASLGLKDLQQTARYLRVRAKNINTIPSWHPAAKQKGWLFVDEIVVNPEKTGK